MLKEADFIGRKATLKGKHPHAGYTGTIVRFGDTALGRYPVVEFDEDGGRFGERACFIMSPDDAEIHGMVRKGTR